MSNKSDVMNAWTIYDHIDEYRGKVALKGGFKDKFLIARIIRPRPIRFDSSPSPFLSTSETLPTFSSAKHS